MTLKAFSRHLGPLLLLLPALLTLSFVTREATARPAATARAAASARTAATAHPPDDKDFVALEKVILDELKETGTPGADGKTEYIFTGLYAARRKQ